MRFFRKKISLPTAAYAMISYSRTSRKRPPKSLLGGRLREVIACGGLDHIGSKFLSHYHKVTRETYLMFEMVYSSDVTTSYYPFSALLSVKLSLTENVQLFTPHYKRRTGAGITCSPNSTHCNCTVCPSVRFYATFIVCPKHTRKSYATCSVSYTDLQLCP